MNPSPKPTPCAQAVMLPPPDRNRTAFGNEAETPALRSSKTGLPGLIEIRQRRTATCSGTQPAIELGFGLSPLPEKAWRARAFLPGLASHKRRRSVQRTRQNGSKLATNTMSIRPDTSEYMAVYIRVYGRIPGMHGQVYGRILAVYSRIPWVYGRIHKVHSHIPKPWHWVGERYACYTCKQNVSGSNPTALKYAKTCVGH